MISDLRTTFAAGTAVNTGAPGSYLVGNVIDLSTTGRDLGAGEGAGDVFFHVVNPTAITGGSTSTAAFNLATSDDSTFATGVSTVIAGATIPINTTLAAGTSFAGIRIPPYPLKRYLGLIQVTGVAALTGGTITGDFVEDLPANRYYPQSSVF